MLKKNLTVLPNKRACPRQIRSSRQFRTLSSQDLPFFAGHLDKPELGRRMFSTPLYKLSIIDRPLAKGKGEVSLSAFSFLFSEMVQYCQTRVSNIGELERRLEDTGFGVGLRLLEILSFREKGSKRDIRLLDVLKFVHTSLWKYLFGHQARDLEQSNTAEDEYMISDYDLFVNKFISVPKDMGQLNCAAYVAGIVKGALEGAGFPARVTAHFVPVKGQPKPKTTILMKFDAAVLAREHRLLL